jgi:uracil-DNA glycosylase
MTSLSTLRDEASRCRACHLWKNATQTVFGEGPQDAQMMLVGEQPGDKEDLAGKPFVGPAGQILDRALEEAGVNRKKVYVTNAVKHFKFVLRGKIRLHQKQKPNNRRSRPAGHGTNASWPRSNLTWWWRWGLPRRNACSGKSRRSTKIAGD